MIRKIDDMYVNGGVCTLVAGAVDPGFKNDAIDCGLYVQLAASKQFDRFTHFHDWQAALIKALTAFGWLRLDFTSQLQPLSAPSVVADLMGTALANALDGVRVEQMDQEFATQLTRQCAEAADALVENSVQLSRSDGVSSVVLQLALLLPSRQMVLLGLAFETLETIESNPFAQRLDKQSLIGDLKSFVFVGTLDDLRYAQYRQRISEALEHRRSRLCVPFKGAFT